MATQLYEPTGEQQPHRLFASLALININVGGPIQHIFLATGNVAYGAGTGGPTVKQGKTKGKNTTRTLTVWEGRSAAPFVADQHLYFNVGDDFRVLGDPNDYNNGVTSHGVRVTPWREIRR